MKPSHLRILFGNRFHTAKSIIDMPMYRWTTWSLSIVIASARALWCLFRAGTVTFWIFWWLDTPLKGWKKILLYISWSVVLKAVLLGYMRFEGCMVHTSVMKLEIAGAGSIFEVESPIGCQQLAVFHHSTVFFGAVLFWPIRMDVSFERRLDLLIHSKKPEPDSSDIVGSCISLSNFWQWRDKDCFPDWFLACTTCIFDLCFQSCGPEQEISQLTIIYHPIFWGSSQDMFSPKWWSLFWSCISFRTFFPGPSCPWSWGRKRRTRRKRYC